MALAYGVARKKANGFFVDQNVHPQTIDCVRTRAEPIGVQVHVGDWRTFEMEGKDIMGALIQVWRSVVRACSWRARTCVLGVPWCVCVCVCVRFLLIA